MFTRPKLPKLSKGLFLLLSVVTVFYFSVRLGYSALGNWLYGSTEVNDASATTQQPQSGKVKGITSGSVKAVADDITQNGLAFRIKVYFLETIQAISAKFDNDVEVGGDLTVGSQLTIGDILTVGNDVTIDNDL
jgi:hypothetical protein